MGPHAKLCFPSQSSILKTLHFLNWSVQDLISRPLIIPALVPHTDSGCLDLLKMCSCPSLSGTVSSCCLETMLLLTYSKSYVYLFSNNHITLQTKSFVTKDTLIIILLLCSCIIVLIFILYGLLKYSLIVFPVKQFFCCYVAPSNSTLTSAKCLRLGHPLSLRWRANSLQLLKVLGQKLGDCEFQS